MLDNVEILEKTLRLIKSSKSCSDVTDTIQGADPKVAYGMTEKKREIYFYITVPKKEKVEAEVYSPNSLSDFFKAEVLPVSKVEPIYVHFTDQYFDDKLFTQRSEGLSFGTKKFKTNRILKGKVEIYFQKSVIYESSDSDTLSYLFAILTNRAAELKEELVSDLQPKFLDL